MKRSSVAIVAAVALVGIDIAIGLAVPAVSAKFAQRALSNGALPEFSDLAQTYLMGGASVLAGASSLGFLAVWALLVSRSTRSGPPEPSSADESGQAHSRVGKLIGYGIAFGIVIIIVGASAALVAGSLPTSRSMTGIVRAASSPGGCAGIGPGGSTWNTSVPRGTVMVVDWYSLDGALIDAVSWGNTPILGSGPGSTPDLGESGGTAGWMTLESSGGVYTFGATWSGTPCGLAPPVEVVLTLVSD